MKKMKLIYKHIFSLLIMMLFCSPLLSAQENNPLEIQNTDIRSSRNTYLGGVDEEDILVSEDQSVPYRVVNLKLVQKKVQDSLLKAATEADSENEEGSGQ